MRKPVVAIIGRQNVGKSTLFNALVGKPVAIVEDLPGTTRDRIFGDVSWHERDFILVDTGGLEPDAQTSIARGVNAQVEVAIDDADLLLFIVDVKDGTVTLTGTVNSSFEKRAAGDDAWEVPGVRDVQNNLQIKT